jgi:P-type Ca2+ transporter type 2C
VGAYVGIATVGIFAVWYLFPSFLGIPIIDDGHSLVTWQQLRTFEQCPSWPAADFNPTQSFSIAGGGKITFAQPCDFFTDGKIKACTLSLTVIVVIEMFNALNALSEDGSLLQMPPWCNPWLLVAMAISFGLHFLILYVPFLSSVFSIVPLSWNEWLLVLLFSAPVILIDEVLKFIGRVFVNPPRMAVKDKQA